MRAANVARQTGPAHHVHGFGGHLLEMRLAMMVGMIVSAAIFLTAVGMTAEEGMRERAVLFVVLQELGMTVAMVAWMHHRRHNWRSSSEMAMAMVADDPFKPAALLEQWWLKAWAPTGQAH